MYEAKGPDGLVRDIENILTMESEPKDEEAIKNLKKLIEVLEDNDDVQKVYHNSSVNFMD